MYVLTTWYIPITLENNFLQVRVEVEKVQRATGDVATHP